MPGSVEKIRELKVKITNWLFCHQLVIITFSSLLWRKLITRLITTLIVEHPRLHQACKLLHSDSTLRSAAKLLKTGLAVSSQQSAVNRPYHVALINKSRSQLCQIHTVTLYTLYTDCQIVTVRYSLRYIYCPIVTVISE